MCGEVIVLVFDYRSTYKIILYVLREVKSLKKGRTGMKKSHPPLWFSADLQHLHVLPPTLKKCHPLPSMTSVHVCACAGSHSGNSVSQWRHLETWWLL